MRKSHNTCHRCGFECPHVEAGGIHYCPNCGTPSPVSDGVVYKFGQGCQVCGLVGHQPKPGYMEPVRKSHPRYVLGLAPCIEDLEREVEVVQES